MQLKRIAPASPVLTAMTALLLIDNIAIKFTQTLFIVLLIGIKDAPTLN